MKRKNDLNHYIDNKEFLKAMKEHRRKVIQSKKHDTQKPQISDYIGECIIKIAQRLSNRPNFINYPFKEEMISDGIENCLMYINNFNPNKSKNPFAYFTQIVFFAFVRRIQKEKKQLYTKYKIVENAISSDFYDNLDNKNVAPPQKYISDYSDEYMHEFVSNFEKSKNEKKIKSRKKISSLEKFLNTPIEKE